MVMRSMGMLWESSVKRENMKRRAVHQKWDSLQIVLPSVPLQQHTKTSNISEAAIIDSIVEFPPLSPLQCQNVLRTLILVTVHPKDIKLPGAINEMVMRESFDDFNVGPKPFKFHSFWMAHGQFQDILKSAWTQHVSGNPVKVFTAKLKIVKQEMRKLNKKNYSQISYRVVQFIKDKSRIKWLQVGDANTAIFHRKLKVHHTHNRILTLTNFDGVKLTNYEEVFKVALSSAQAESLIVDISDKKIKDVLFDMKEGAAPGPNGFTMDFFKKNWRFVGDERQNAFLKGRKIFDNILLMHELVKNYHHKGGKARCVLKVDIMEAYDIVRWEFLASSCGVLFYARGLRQGDPISPFLFLLIMEAFTQLFDANTASFGYNFHPRCAKFQISHISFADDLFILVAATQQSMLTIKATLEEFSAMSGLNPNLAKFELYMSSGNDQLGMAFSSLIGMPLGRLLVKYLGIPLVSTKLTSVDCQPILDKILRRIKSCIFIIPKMLIKKVESALNAFLWSGVEMKSTNTKLLGVSENAKVSAIIKERNWNWPMGRCQRGELTQLIDATSSYFLSLPDTMIMLFGHVMFMVSIQQNLL
ncbi:uncharacterized protein [Coffea arabica]|uniref:Reverse transcriptase domain-containing protein n=1 Tax=Coffea arabica TaxID=13443 RepID=A0ABM4VUA4_COFAR